jgi:hypothetical protein
MAKNLPKLAKDTNLQIEEAKCIPKLNEPQNPTPLHSRQISRNEEQN